MKTVDVLKGAKQHLQTEADEEGKVFAICFAIKEYVETQPHHTTLVSAHARAQELVMDRLIALAGANISFFSYECASTVLGEPCYTKAQKQRARHIWLDSLIKELEND